MSQKTLGLYRLENVEEQVEELRRIDYADDSFSRASDLEKMVKRVQRTIDVLRQINGRMLSMAEQRIAEPFASYGRS